MTSEGNTKFNVISTNWELSEKEGIREINTLEELLNMCDEEIQEDSECRGLIISTNVDGTWSIEIYNDYRE